MKPKPTHVPDLVPARMINEALFCERLLYLEWVQGEFTGNYFTADGTAVHQRPDKKIGKMPVATEDTDRPYKATSVWLSSENLGITSKIDVVEGHGKNVAVIEYKRGAAPDVPDGAYLPERAQVCAQVLLLREHGYNVDEASLYFAETKRRVPVVIDDALIQATLGAVARARELCAAPQVPPPLVDSPKCSGCSLVSICLPDEVSHLSTGAPVRQLRPLRDDCAPLHVQEQGAKIGLRGDRIVVRLHGTEVAEARLVHTSSVSVYGNVQVSTQAMRELLFRDVPVSFFSTGGWYCGRTVSADSKNIDVRVAQFSTFTDPTVCLRLARGIVVSKIRNSRTLLRRNADPSRELLRRLDIATQSAESAGSMESLLGIEGSAAKDYFSAFAGMLKTDCGFSLDGRNRRPPRDPVNALLSLAYSLLTRDLVGALVTCGLEPLLGFYHQPRFGRPSLALDLMEEFRPVVADSAVVTAINTGVVGTGDFASSAGAVTITPSARRNFIQCYERRMDQLVTHPVFDYRVSYRRVLEMQARLLTRVLFGEIADLPQFKVR